MALFLFLWVREAVRITFCISLLGCSTAAWPPAVGSRNRWIVSGSWARQANKLAPGHCWLMQNLLLVLPHSSTELLLRWKYLLGEPKLLASNSKYSACTVWSLTQLQVCSYLGFSCKDSTHVVSPCDFESVFAVVHVYVHVCAQGFYVHDLIPQCAKHLQRWLRGRACECPRAPPDVHALLSLPHSFLVKADRAHTKFI